MKKTIAIILALALILSFAACGKKTADKKTIKVGASITPHAEILREAAKLLEKEGITLEVVEYTDYVQPNTAVEDGSLDANYFQHTPYLNTFNKENKTHIVSVGAVHYEPFGIYAGKVKALADLPEGAKIGVPNDGSNETRALLLLQQEGFIKLKDGIDASISTMSMFLGFSTMSSLVALEEASMPSFSLMKPSCCSRSRARVSLLPSLGTPILAPSGRSARVFTLPAYMPKGS